MIRQEAEETAKANDQAIRQIELYREFFDQREASIYQANELKDAEARAADAARNLEFQSIETWASISSDFIRFTEKIREGTGNIGLDFLNLIGSIASAINRYKQQEALTNLLLAAAGNTPGRAFGGPVSAGQLYQVNERTGGEYFIPSQNGMISPRSRGSDMGGNNYYTINANDATGVERILKRYIPGILEMADARLYNAAHRPSNTREAIRYAA